MAKNDTAAQLLALASDASKRTKYARFMDVIEPIEVALASGVSRETVRSTLSSEGLQLSVETFKSFLYRARRRKSMAHLNPAATDTVILQIAPARLPSSPRSNERPATATTAPSFDPAELRAVRSSDDLDDLTQLGKKGRK